MRLFRGLDFGRAFLALTLAAALWWVISTEQNPERHELFPSPIPVEVVNAPPSLVVTGEIPSIQAQVRAPSEAWTRLRSSSLRATADASRASPGTNDLPVRLEILDPGIRAAEPVPPRVTVVMEESKERLVPVRVNLTGAVPFGYSSGQAKVAPEIVTVSGPASIVQRVQEALVEIPLDQLTLSINSSYQPIPVDARRERVTGVKLSPATVSVEVAVSQNVTYREVGIRPVVRGKLAPGYYLEPVEVNPPSATIFGDPAAVAGIATVETEPIDVDGLASTAVRPVFLRAPAGVTFLQPKPVNITLRVSPIPTTQTLQVVPTTIGLGSGLQLTDLPGTVEVTITGPAPTLQSLAPKDFRMVLDLTGLTPGQHTVTVQPQIPAALSLESFGPKSMSVTIRDVAVPTSQASPTPVP